ncbi:N-acetyl-gamma-glutamyl-phosphate reductase [Apiospora arundinis]|uniref:N-acetyl-gamma-glutamyl-phosphate reductase n=1 Tax=Apiospora arundinis TaxID=335852 RepID=A0ABR2I2T0_9PEZI
MGHDRRKSDKKEHVSKTHTSKSSGSSKPPEKLSCRFLFQVSELRSIANLAPTVDDLQNQLPPQYPEEFDEKIYGNIFRYDNGDISVAHGLSLSQVRPEYNSEESESPRPSTIGYITDRVLNNENHQVEQLSESRWLPFESYSTVTMYNCGPFAPCLIRPGDASDPHDPVADLYPNFRMMHFFNHEGVSRASNSGNVRMVAGRNATWVGSLVPEAYNNHRAHNTSIGLGGEFSLLIGLMALAQPYGRCDDAFTDPQWARHRWTGRRNPSGWPRDTDPVRGVVVEIACEKTITEKHGPPGSTMEDIYRFEWQGLAVRDL